MTARLKWRREVPSKTEDFGGSQASPLATGLLEGLGIMKNRSLYHWTILIIIRTVYNAAVHFCHLCVPREAYTIVSPSHQTDSLRVVRSATIVLRTSYSEHNF